MKTMLTKASIIGVLTLYGCGSNTNGENSKEGQSVNTILEKSDAVVETISSMDNGFKSNTTNSTPKMIQKIINAKSNYYYDGTYRCSPEKTYETDNGTKSIETLEDGTVRITYHYCQEDGVGINGVLLSHEYDNGITAWVYKKYMYIYLNESNKIKVDYSDDFRVVVSGKSYILHGDLSLAKYENNELTILEEDEFNQFTYLEQDKNTIYVNGTESIKVGSCTTAVSFKYEMPEYTWLKLNSKDHKYIDSGEITINDKHYIYDGETVDVSYKEKRNTFTQKELLEEQKRIKYAESCSEQPREVSSKMFNSQFNYKLNIEKFLN